MHEQAPIARQQSPAFDFHYAEQLSVLGSGIVSDIETEQAQIARECSKVSVSYKFG